jgi:hypothetical protein
MYNFADSSVTASAFTSGANTALTLVATTAGLTTTAALVIYYDDQLASTTVTISSLPAISGTVSIGNLGDGINTFWADSAVNDITSAVNGGIGTYIINNDALPISGVVTANGGDFASSDSNLPFKAVQLGYFDEFVSNNFVRVTPNKPFPVQVLSSTVTANPTGTQTIAGSVTLGAGTAQIGSVTASISGTVPISISSVTVGNSVTIGSLPAISGVVTANLSISSTAITSGSFTSLTSATLVPANTARKMATVYNLGAGQLFINAGTSATTLGGGFMVALSSGDFYECPYTTTTLSAIFATAGTASWMSH